MNWRSYAICLSFVLEKNLINIK